MLLVAAVACIPLFMSCTDVPDPSADTMVIVETEVPTTMLDVGFLDVLGFSYCEVVDQVASDIQAYADPSSDLGDAGGTRDAYVGALRGFDALGQVAPDVISADVALMRKTLDDSVTAGLAAGWDITQIQDTAVHGVDARKVAAALGSVRTYTLEHCKVDITRIPEQAVVTDSETPQQRIRRILGDLFPGLDNRKLACLEPRLPLDFDPDSMYFDEQQLLDAFAGCRIDIEDPSAPTSVPPAPFREPRPTTPATTTLPGGGLPEYGTGTEDNNP